jgi:hypothetical protein
MKVVKPSFEMMKDIDFRFLSLSNLSIKVEPSGRGASNRVIVAK